MLEGWRKKIGRLLGRDKVSRQLLNTPDADADSKDSPDQSSRQQLVLGFDFGTAFTKVVLGETRKHFAVPFREYTEGSNPYLLPGRFYIDEADACSLSPRKGREVSDLKMRVLENRCSDQDLVEIAAFMALVMRHARTWLLSEHSAVYGRATIDWLVNSGLPTDTYHDERLANIYQTLLLGAWEASFHASPITIGIVQSALANSRAPQGLNVRGTISPDAVAMFPEFVAQITGYVSSPMRKEDLHLLIDVGAGTVDVSVFNVLYADGEHRFPILAKLVVLMGTARLMQRRLEETGCADRILDPFREIPSRRQLARELGVNEATLMSIDCALKASLRKEILQLLRRTKKLRYRMSRRWHEGVPTFLVGGGSRVDAFMEVGKELAAMRGDIRLASESLVMPDDLEAPLASKESYDRLSVAYGLSFDPFDIGGIIKTSEIADDEKLDTDPETLEPTYADWYKS